MTIAVLPRLGRLAQAPAWVAAASVAYRLNKFRAVVEQMFLTGQRHAITFGSHTSAQTGLAGALMADWKRMTTEVFAAAAWFVKPAIAAPIVRASTPRLQIVSKTESVARTPMKRPLTIRASLIFRSDPMIRTAAFAVAVALFSASAFAQQAAPAAKPALKPLIKKGKATAPAEKPLAPADQTQLDAAERTLYGPYQCDFNQTIDVSINPKTPGYVDVAFAKKVYTMKPVLSSTGALRLEDVKGVTLLLQIANKSMLMDTKAGRRLVDACVHEKQRASAAAIEAAAAGK